jgi:hypothetical protein
MKIHTNMIKIRCCQRIHIASPDLNEVSWRPNVLHYLERLVGPPSPADKLVHAALRGVERNQALILVPVRARLTALVYRIAPGLVNAIGYQIVAAEVKERPQGSC